MAKMGEEHDVIGSAAVARVIHGCLNGRVELLAGVIDGKVVYELAGIVLEGGRGAAGRRRGDADVSHADRRIVGWVFDDVVGLKDAGAVGIGEIAAGVRCALDARQLA